MEDKQCENKMELTLRAYTVRGEDLRDGTRFEDCIVVSGSVAEAEREIKKRYCELGFRATELWENDTREVALDLMELYLKAKEKVDELVTAEVTP